ncbi:MAG: cbb3-type cytochrome c oxidase subunit 3 [Pseudobdellovibrionaceae bacterium]
MKKEGLAFFTDLHWTQIGLLIFFVSFIVLLILQQMIYKKEDVKALEQLPFEGDPS